MNYSYVIFLSKIYSFGYKWEKYVGWLMTRRFIKGNQCKNKVNKVSKI